MDGGRRKGRKDGGGWVGRRGRGSRGRGGGGGETGSRQAGKPASEGGEGGQIEDRGGREGKGEVDKKYGRKAHSMQHAGRQHWSIAALSMHASST